MRVSFRSVIYLHNHLNRFLKQPLSLSMSPPDRWGNYTPVGSVTDGTRIFACKVPLKKDLCNQLQERFTPQDLITMVTDRGQKLGMVVDLTYTNKYYDGVVFKRNAIKYVKIMTAGHNIPNDDVYCTFADCISDYIDNPEQKDCVVGVHCTHGVNRTGYFICRYMIEKLNVQPEEAIVAFGKARGHPIERENYLNDLKKRTVGQVTPYPEDYVKDENKYCNVKKQPSHPTQRSEHNRRHMSSHSVHYGMFSPQESARGRAPHLGNMPRSFSDYGSNSFSNQFSAHFSEHSPGVRQDRWQPGNVPSGSKGFVDHNVYQQFDRTGMFNERSRGPHPHGSPYYGRTRNFQSDYGAPWNCHFNGLHSPSHFRRGALYRNTQHGAMPNDPRFATPYRDRQKGSYTSFKKVANNPPFSHKNEYYHRSRSAPNADSR